MEDWCVNQFLNQSRTMNHDQNVEDVVPMPSKESVAHFAMPETTRKTHTTGPTSTSAVWLGFSEHRMRVPSG